jgi:hypothetical protein
MNESMIEKMRAELEWVIGTYGKLGANLRFSDPNAKLEGIMSFSLPAGHACPGAHQCMARTLFEQGYVNPNNGRETIGFFVKDGPDCQFRCFAATDESKYPATRNQRWHNFLMLLDCKGHVPSMVALIEKALPKTWAPIRLHVAGDFFTQAYFDAWLIVAKNHPNQVFYAYTKSLPFWIARLSEIPSNFRLTASYGGKWDALIKPHNLRYAQVVWTENEAKLLGLEIDHDDSHAFNPGPSFALLLHGTQPAGSPAAKAWSALKMVGKGGYHNQRTGRQGLGRFYVDKKKKRNTGGINSPRKKAKVKADMSESPYPIEMIVDGVPTAVDPSVSEALSGIRIIKKNDPNVLGKSSFTFEEIA